MKYEIGQTASFAKTITETDLYNFAGICGDFNPVHVNKIEAKTSIWGKQIVHGMLVASFISTVLGMYLPGPGTVYVAQEMKFCKPVFIGDTVNASVEIMEIMDNGKATLRTWIMNQHRECVIDGCAKVILPNIK